ncbi:MAG: hypothetical protein A2033_15555 [Bacteroidetes bacterium GWA2_31_9]|nr:MAG: hypothetical protein A2033_15555 [Bacteroidetes bacterium GWA2_31_9]
MDKISLNVLGLTYSQTQSGAYALLLSEENGERRLPIIIGGYEAQAIAIELEGLKPPRPLTHDLFVSLARTVEIKFTEVNIYKLEEGIFFSELVIQSRGAAIRIDARTSDAIALALRFKCPIYTTEEILTKAGIILDFDKQQKQEIIEEGLGEEHKEKIPIKSTSKSSKYSSYNLTDLNGLLEKAIGDEDYEKASEIRDEISKRSKEQ